MLLSSKKQPSLKLKTRPKQLGGNLLLNMVLPMFVERKVRYSALFTNLVRWHVGAVSFPPSDVILAQLACPLSDVMFCLHLGITNLVPSYSRNMVYSVGPWNL